MSSFYLKNEKEEEGKKEKDKEKEVEEEEEKEEKKKEKEEGKKEEKEEEKKEKEEEGGNREEKEGDEEEEMEQNTTSRRFVPKKRSNLTKNWFSAEVEWLDEGKVEEEMLQEEEGNKGKENAKEDEEMYNKNDLNIWEERDEFTERMANNFKKHYFDKWAEELRTQRPTTNLKQFSIIRNEIDTFKQWIMSELTFREDYFRSQLESAYELAYSAKHSVYQMQQEVASLKADLLEMKRKEEVKEPKKEETASHFAPIAAAVKQKDDYNCACYE